MLDTGLNHTSEYVLGSLLDIILKKQMLITHVFTFFWD